MITMLADRMESISLSYWFFFKQSWLFDHEKYYKVCDSLNAFDKEEFFMDMRKIDLSEGGVNYAHGLAKYYLLEDIPALDSGLKQVVQMNQLQFNHDLRFGHRSYKDLQYRDLKDLYPSILDPSRFEQFLTDLFFGTKRDEKPNWVVSNYPIPSSSAVVMLDVPHAQLQLKGMHAKICKRTLALSMAFFNRKMRQLSNGVYLQQQGFDEIRKLL